MRRNACASSARITSTGYVRLTLPGSERVLEHRWIWEQEHGPIPEGGLIHHKNGVKDDNRPGNLVLVESISAHNQAHGGTLRSSYPAKTMAACHPGRPNRGRGLCLSCYMKDRRGTLTR